MLLHKQIIIRGRVENTGFRLHAMRGASVFNIFGEVRQREGEVVIEAEGEERDLEGYIEWCGKGVYRSIVQSIDTNEKTIFGYSDFKIL
jgi:acylphosphatase